MRKIDILLRSILCLFLLSSFSFAAQKKSTKAQTSQEKAGKALPAQETPKYKNPTLPIDDRVTDLLSRMTLEEKVEQICGGSRAEMQVVDPTGTYTTESAREVLTRWWDPDLEFTPRKAAILRKRRAALHARGNAARNSGVVHGRGAARIHGVREHQLSA